MIEKMGTEQTRRFYDDEGWKTDHEARPLDRNLFGVKGDGPIRIELHGLHVDRVRRALSVAGPRLNLLECGCGGGPERAILDMCSKYTGVDFSTRGLELARSSFKDVAIPYDFQCADVCALPFADGTFDAVYCAHMIYHIENPAAQEAALAELVRVVRPGGVVVVIGANPRPLAFPVRFVRRLAADTPILGRVLNRLRAKPPLPYNPMSIGWMRRRLAHGGPVKVIAHRFESTAFNQKVSEYSPGGKRLWKGIRWLDVSHPRISAYLGNYVILTCQKRTVS